MKATAAAHAHAIDRALMLVASIDPNGPVDTLGAPAPVSSFQMLAGAVLAQAVRDLEASAPAVRRDAWRWLTIAGTIPRARIPFAECCAVLELDPATVREWVLGDGH